VKALADMRVVFFKDMRPKIGAMCTSYYVALLQSYRGRCAFDLGSKLSLNWTPTNKREIHVISMALMQARARLNDVANDECSAKK
jgi:hypothetical protein